jgi:heptosyltransferase-2/heptosyltransferase-3
MRPDHLGDVLLATPALTLLRRSLPDAEVTCLIGPWARDVLRGNPDVDVVIGCPFPGFAQRPARGELRGLALLGPYLLLVSCAAQLRRRGPYDAALILRDDHWWGALLAAVAGIPIRLGVARPESAPFLTHAIAPHTLRDRGGRHRAEQNLVLATLLVEHLGVPSAHGQAALPWPPLRTVVDAEAAQAAEDLLAAHGVAPGERLVALQPGAGAVLKHWSAPAFARLAGELARTWGVRVLVLGTAAERDLATEIARLAGPPGRDGVAPPVVLAGATSWGMLAAVLDRCALVAGVDSGTLHLAVARGRPSVAIFGPVDPALFGPWGDPHGAPHAIVAAGLPCQPCGRLDLCPLQGSATSRPVPCLAAVTPAAVLAAIAGLTGMMEGR